MRVFFASTQRDWLFGVTWLTFGDTRIEIGFGPWRIVITTEDDYNNSGEELYYD